MGSRPHTRTHSHHKKLTILGPIPGHDTQEVPSKNSKYLNTRQPGTVAALYKPEVVQVTCGFPRGRQF